MQGGVGNLQGYCEWHDAETGSWVDQNAVMKLSQVEKQLFGHMKVTFQPGKGNNHLVPVLIPDDTAEALRQLSDVDRRKECGVQEGNRYLFPCIYGSLDHVSGWHAVRKVCTEAGVADPSLLTATKMRHRISTLYAGWMFRKKSGHTSIDIWAIRQT